MSTAVNHGTFLRKLGHSCTTLIIGLAALHACNQRALAATDRITDGNSSVNIQHDSVAGMNDWCVDGVPQLYQQWFWYRIGNVCGESSLDTISLVSNNQCAPNSTTALYQNSQLSVQISYTLHGGAFGSGYSLLEEEIRIQNISANPLVLSFFQFTDFDLAGDALGDTLQLTGTPGAFTGMFQYKDGRFAQITTSLPADHGQVAFAGVLHQELNDGDPTTLEDSIGPIYGDTMSALQWDRTLAPGEVLEFEISKILSVPEPSAASLLLIGLAGVILRKQRRSV